MPPTPPTVAGGPSALTEFLQPASQKQQQKQHKQQQQQQQQEQEQEQQTAPARQAWHGEYPESTRCGGECPESTQHESSRLTKTAFCRVSAA